MSDKPFKEKDWTDKVLPIGAAAIAIFFIVFGFFVKQDCDIDRVYLWCRLHPLSFFDIIGVIMFLAGCFLLSGVYKFWNPENSVKWNLIWFALMFLSVVIIWNL